MQFKIQYIWLSLVLYMTQCKVITVNNDGIDNEDCCENGTCSCNSLSHALQSLTNNTIINIEESVMLQNITSMGTGHLNNVKLVGNNVTIRCNNAGAISFLWCSNIIIEGIVFDQCGRYPVVSGGVLSGVHFHHIFNISIKKCIFQNSKTFPVVLNDANGNTVIQQSDFIFNAILYQQFTTSNSESVTNGLFIGYGSSITNILLKENKFKNNGHLDVHQGILLYSVIIYPVAEVQSFKHSSFIIHNIEFSNNTRGLYLYGYSCPAMIINMSELTFHKNIEEGMKIFLNGCSNSLHNISVSSSNFENNANSLTVYGIPRSFKANIELINSTFVSNKVIFMWQSKSIGTVTLTLLNSKSDVILYRCTFTNNLNTVISLHMQPAASICYEHTITLSNVLVNNTTINSNASNDIVSIITSGVKNLINFENVRLELNDYNKLGGGVVHVVMSGFCDPMHREKVNFSGCILKQNTAFENVVIVQILNSDENQVTAYYVGLHNSTFIKNFGGTSIVYLSSDVTSHPGHFTASSTSFFHNNGIAITCFSLSIFELSGVMQFVNNTGENGAAIYFPLVYRITLARASSIFFINNSARSRGGAIYINVPYNCNNNGNVFDTFPNDSYVRFINNTAKLAGNSIFFSIPETCDVFTDADIPPLLSAPNMFTYYPKQKDFDQITSTPLNIEFDLSTDNTTKHTNSSTYLIPSPKMLGKPVTFTATVLDYFNRSAEPTIFRMSCDNCGSDYVLSKKQVSVSNNSQQEFQISSNLLQDVNSSGMHIKITFTAVIPPLYKQFKAKLAVKLSSCQRGHKFNTSKCVCYPDSNIVRCYDNYSEIKIGHWVRTIPDSRNFTSSLCPSIYCVKRSETSPGYFALPNEADGQCRSNRRGVACGECTSGYTLAYDSPNCTHKSNCCAGITVLVVLLTIIYWFLVVAVVFAAMYFNSRVLSGYVYGIIYYYSIVDILLSNNLHISEDIFQAISIISSFAKLNPRVFGHLCFVEGLSGIDQYLIHYSHAAAVSILTLIAVVAARNSLKIARYISRCIIRVICLLILLSYTSLATSSLQLLRPLYFKDIDDVRTFLSPGIEYFSRRHLAHAIVALFGEVLVIGFALLLLFEPLIRKKVTLTKIKPLLDQFQGCFKYRYRWFAVYYLICRQVIILIVYVGNENYYNMLFYLQTACIIIAMIHYWFQPYKDTFLNVLDGILLLMLVMIISLNVFSDSLSSAVEGLAIVLVLLPVIIYLFVAVCN